MERLAIVGTGIAGLGCAHFLHGRFDLTIYEQGSHAGGQVVSVKLRSFGARELARKVLILG